MMCFYNSLDLLILRKKAFSKTYEITLQKEAANLFNISCPYTVSNIVKFNLLLQ